MIPRSFSKIYHDEFSDMATLVVPNGQRWHVELCKDEKRVWFDDGWGEFIQHHAISVGNLLVFKYMKNSTFNVKIFDHDTSFEIDYPDFVDGAPGN